MTWRQRLQGFAWGALGVAVVLLLVHAYYDHKALHDLVTFTNMAAPKIQKLP